MLVGTTTGPVSIGAVTVKLCDQGLHCVAVADPHPQRVGPRAALVRGLRELRCRDIVVLVRAKRLTIDDEVPASGPAVPEIVLR